MSAYLAIKTIHISCAVLSLLGFLLRGVWMLMESSWLNKRVVKILPHVIDTVLLVSAITLLILNGLNLFQTDWLLTKIILLIVYILLGAIALKRGKTKGIRTMAFFTATFVIVSIFLVARFKPML